MNPDTQPMLGIVSLYLHYLVCSAPPKLRLLVQYRRDTMHTWSYRNMEVDPEPQWCYSSVLHFIPPQSLSVCPWTIPCIDSDSENQVVVTLPVYFSVINIKQRGGRLHAEVICSYSSYSPEMDSSANNNNTSWKTSDTSTPGMCIITQACWEMYCRALRGVRRAGGNKD
jgi:hypothetical protein